MRKLILFGAVLALGLPVFGEPKYKKTQEVAFDGSDVDGTVRSPDGAYLLQKRGVKFSPLYKIETQMDLNVLESINYLK